MPGTQDLEMTKGVTEAEIRMNLMKMTLTREELSSSGNMVQLLRSLVLGLSGMCHISSKSQKHNDGDTWMSVRKCVKC